MAIKKDLEKSFKEGDILVSLKIGGQEIAKNVSPLLLGVRVSYAE